MLNTIHAIAATRWAIANYGPLILAITDRIDLVYRRFARLSTLAPIALGAILCTAASTVQAQGYALAPTARSGASGWLSSAPTESVATPWFVLNVPDRREPRIYNSSRSAAASGRAERTRNAILNPGRFWLAFPATQSVDYGFLPTDSLPRVSYLSLLEVTYQVWEANLAETRTPTDVNGVLVYPLVQIDYPTGHFPIALSIAPLRGSSDVR